MTMTKKKKKLLSILIPVGVVVIAAIVVAVVLILQNNQPKRYLQDISVYDNTPQPVMVVEGGLEQALVPLPRYSVSDQTPEGYLHAEQSAQVANRFSYEYRDTYYAQDGSQVILRQQTAGQHIQVGFAGEIQHGSFAGMELHYAVGDTQSTAAWLCGDTLFILETQGQALSLEEMMAFANLVDYSAPAQPEIRPLEFVEGDVLQFGNQLTLLPWRVGGNPQLPDQLEYYTFTQVPEGYSETAAVTNYVLPTYLLEETGIDFGSSSDWAVSYTNPQGNVLTLVNCIVGDEGSIFQNLPGYDSTKPLEVQEVTVNGMEGRLYAGPSYYELVLLGDYLYVDLTYQGDISQEEFLALAELVGK